MSRSQILLFGIQEIIFPGDKRCTVQSDRTDEGRQREGEGLRSQHRILKTPGQRRDEPAKSGGKMEIGRLTKRTGRQTKERTTMVWENESNGQDLHEVHWPGPRRSCHTG